MLIDPNGEPLTLGQAKRRWPREKITQFAVPQPPTPKVHLLSRRGTGTAGHARPAGIHLAAPGLPTTGDITVAPAGRRRRLRARGQGVNPLTVYPPDQRQVFNDTTYPWRACGRVTTPSGQGSGALVGPRHLLTASHVVDWTGNNTAGWLLFQPDFFDTDVFPSAYSLNVISYEQIGQPQGEYDVAEDYVVCVLDTPIGNQLGWFGARTYDDGWDGGAYWNHVGYPGDVGNGTRPAWELFFAIKNSWHPGFFESGHGMDIETFASLNHGDSGGPVFGWWDDGPYIVAVVSAEGSLAPVITDPTVRTANWLAGGAPLVDLVNQVRSDYP
jgi:V8-like Glu-specific endopeptidase